MALSKERVVDKIEIVGHNLQVRYKDRILEDGVELACSFHRETILPFQSVADKDPMIQSIAAVVFTPEVIAEALGE